MGDSIALTPGAGRRPDGMGWIGGGEGETQARGDLRQPPVASPESRIGTEPRGGQQAGVDLAAAQAVELFLADQRQDFSPGGATAGGG